MKYLLEIQIISTAKTFVHKGGKLNSSKHIKVTSASQILQLVTSLQVAALKPRLPFVQKTGRQFQL